jgi:hypothetical protein
MRNSGSIPVDRHNVGVDGEWNVKSTSGHIGCLGAECLESGTN